MTDSEIILWRCLRRKQILELKFSRQKPIDNYIVDFYAAQIKLVIEIDGAQHFDNYNLKYDAIRDRTLSELGVKVLRFTNLDIFKNLNDVLKDIYRNCEERLLIK